MPNIEDIMKMAQEAQAKMQEEQEKLEKLEVEGAAGGGLSWTYSWPPVQGLEFEMDVRGAAREIVI